MTFYIYEPHGYRMPYDPVGEWRNVRRGHEKQAIRPTEQEPRPEWVVEAEPEREEHILPPMFDQERYGKGKQRGRGPLLAMHIMSQDVDTLRATDTLEAAWDLISKHRYRHLPIVDDKNVVIGILSDRKLSRELVNRSREDPDEVMALPISEIMVRPVLTAEPNTAVDAIAGIFIRERVGAMPIVDHEHRLMGILTRSDILRTLVQVPRPGSRA